MPNLRVGWMYKESSYTLIVTDWLWGLCHLLLHLPHNSDPVKERAVVFSKFGLCWESNQRSLAPKSRTITTLPCCSTSVQEYLSVSWEHHAAEDGIADKEIVGKIEFEKVAIIWQCFLFSWLKYPDGIGSLNFTILALPLQLFTYIVSQLTKHWVLNYRFTSSRFKSWSKTLLFLSLNWPAHPQQLKYDCAFSTPCSSCYQITLCLYLL